MAGENPSPPPPSMAQRNPPPPPPSMAQENPNPTPPLPQENQTRKKTKKHTRPQPTEPRIRTYPTPSAGRLVCSVLIVILILAGITALIVWLVYRPSDPRFSVVGAAIYGINTTSPDMISTTMQFTVVTHNPNKRTGVFYDRLSAYISYRNQAITMPVSLPVLFQEPESTVAVSPMLGGDLVPVSQEVSNGLVTDRAYGVVPLRLVLLGRLKWKSGPFWSGHYGIYVKCDMLVGVKKGVAGQAPLLGSPGCKMWKVYCHSHVFGVKVSKEEQTCTICRAFNARRGVAWRRMRHLLHEVHESSPCKARNCHRCLRMDSLEGCQCYTLANPGGSSVGSDCML